MSVGNEHRLVKRMRWSARVIGLISVGFGGTMLIGEAISEFLSQGFITTSIEGSLLVMIAAVALAGCVLSWWRDRLAGSLLVATSLGLGIHIGIFAGRNHVLAWSIVGLPYLVAGVLLFTSRYLSRKT